MSGFDDQQLGKIQRALRRIKVFTIDQLVAFLSCSIPTARVKLRKWGVFTSYNQNGRYYALHEVPRFDPNGLWHYESTYFSRWGNLKKTVVHLICESSSGLSGRQIGELVRLDPRSFLHHFRAVPGIRREKVGGVYIYFSAEAEQASKQMENRSQGMARRAGAVSDAEAALILAALIKHHNISVEQLAALPEMEGRAIGAWEIREFMDRHQLGVKKTATTGRCNC
jgi:hypothetical protein